MIGQRFVMRTLPVITNGATPNNQGDEQPVGKTHDA